jgi:hypothetical protein
MLTRFQMRLVWLVPGHWCTIFCKKLCLESDLVILPISTRIFLCSHTRLGIGTLAAYSPSNVYKHWQLSTSFWMLDSHYYYFITIVQCASMKMISFKLIFSKMPDHLNPYLFIFLYIYTHCLFTLSYYVVIHQVSFTVIYIFQFASYPYSTNPPIHHLLVWILSSILRLSI